MALTRPGWREGLGDVNDEVVVEVDNACFFKSAERDPHDCVPKIGLAVDHSVVKFLDTPGAGPVLIEDFSEDLLRFVSLASHSEERGLSAVLLSYRIGG